MHVEIAPKPGDAKGVKGPVRRSWGPRLHQKGPPSETSPDTSAAPYLGFSMAPGEGESHTRAATGRPGRGTCGEVAKVRTTRK